MYGGMEICSLSARSKACSLPDVRIHDLQTNIHSQVQFYLASACKSISLSQFESMETRRVSDSRSRESELAHEVLEKDTCSTGLPGLQSTHGMAR
jgi:hypothetical protein